MMDSFMPQKPPWWNVLPGGNVQEKGRWAKLSSQPWSWMIKTRSSSDIFRLIPLVPSNASFLPVVVLHRQASTLPPLLKVSSQSVLETRWLAHLWSSLRLMKLHWEVGYVPVYLLRLLDGPPLTRSSADLEKRQPAAVNDVSPEWKRAVPLNKSRRLDNHLGDG